MRHRMAGRKLGRTTEHRIALLRNLSTALFEKEKITTTLAKAKELRPFAEKLVTLSKKETLHARRQVLRHIRNRAVVAKLFDTLSARYAQRPGGYTRILKLGPRRGDHAEMAIVELIGAAESEQATKPKKRKTSPKKAKTSRKKTTVKSEAKSGETEKATKKAGTKKKTAKKKAKAKTKTTKKKAKAKTKAKTKKSAKS